jgi:Bacterial SH3 domain
MRHSFHKRSFFYSLVILLIMFFSTSLVLGQTSLNLGENTQGTLNATTPSQSYTLVILEPQTANFQVLALAQSFQPSLTVLDPSGIAIHTSTMGAVSSVLQASVPLSVPGAYTVIVSASTATTGQYVLSVQPGAPAAPPIPLTLGQPVAASVSTQDPLRSYSFSASATDVLWVNVVSGLTNSGPIVRLKEAETGRTFALSDTALTGVRYQIPVVPLGTVVDYLVEVSHSGAQVPESYTVCLETQNGAIFCPLSGSGPVPTAIAAIPTLSQQQAASPLPPPSATPFRPVSIPPTAACAVASSQGAAINVRSGPGTNFNAVGQLPNSQTALVIGRLGDNSWYQVNYNGILGWISASVVIVGGNCAGIPIVVPTPAVTVAGPTFTPTATFAPTLTAVTQTLNFGLASNYGQIALTSGFVPDPHQVSVVSGGSVNVSYLGGSCRGFATAAPDYRVTYTAGSATLLRFYVSSGADTTLIINDAGGGWRCADDTYGFNPAIDFNNPPSGVYDIWVGNFSGGASNSATLSVTELAGNTP